MAASVPVAVFSIPAVLLKSALAPMAVLLSPVSLKTRASKPIAVLAPPVVLSLSALSPTAMLKLPVVSLLSASLPTAVFPAKSGGAVQNWSAFAPTAVWKLPGTVCSERTPSDCRVAYAFRVNKQGERSSGCIRGSGGVETESQSTGGRVGAAATIGNERRKAGSGVEIARIANERTIANSSVGQSRNNHPDSRCARSAGWTCWTNVACCTRSAGWTFLAQWGLLRP